MFCATAPLYTVSATLHTPINTPLTRSCSTPVPGSRIGFAKVLRVAGAVPSFSLNTSPSLYFAHIASCIAIGIAP